MDKTAPAKQIPCGMDCGACVCGTCAISLTCDIWQMALQARPTRQPLHAITPLSGITFPPDIRPPITRVLAA